MSQLEVRLVELGGRLAIPDGEGLLARVRNQLDAPVVVASPPRGRRLRRRIGALVVAAAVGLVALPGTRTAIADFFRVDGVELRPESALGRPRDSGSTTTSPATTPPVTLRPAGALAAARQQAEFVLRVPAAALPTAVTVDPTVPGALVTLEYPEFRLVQFAAPADGAILTKFVTDETKIAPTEVRGRPGYWITGTHHQIASLDRNEDVRIDTLRSVGHVLLWSEGGVTIRIEGPKTLAAAIAIADALA